MTLSTSRRPLELPLLAVLFLLFASASGLAQEPRLTHAQRNYEKSEHRIPMRDGVTLYTSIYRPRDRSRSYPFLLKRTPYSCRPYGPDSYPGSLGPSRYVMHDGYVFVYQDVRGRYMSEGRYDNMRPHLPDKRGPQDIDESSDTWDTIEWLLANVEGHNGRVGQWGISYPGFYTAASLADPHPALVASSPQAPIADFFFDDFHHHGAYTLSYWRTTPVFGHQKEAPTTERWWEMVDLGTPDGHRFYLDLGPLENSARWYGDDNFFWRQLVQHPNYDEFWQARNLLPHLGQVHGAVMTVGGWFDAEDLYGPLQIYRRLEAANPEGFNVLVMGPWGHGDWARVSGHQIVGDACFGEGLSQFFQRHVERPFFRQFLKGQGRLELPEALVFDTGCLEWRRFDTWPPAAVERDRLHLRALERLAAETPRSDEEPFSEYLSDPANPVPYTQRIRVVFTPRHYMAEDQRFAARRPDVLVFQTEPLSADLTIAGTLLAHLEISTSESAADWVVKLIDVLPDDELNAPCTPDGAVRGGMQQLVRSEILRGRFRNDYVVPEPFVPGEVTAVRVPLQDVLHTFRAGHRLMIHVQSSWFPLFDRNPQRWVENVFLAREQDFVAATHRVYHSPEHASWLEFDKLSH